MSVWIIEILENGKWVPTVGVCFSRSVARDSLRYEWRANNSSDKFRIRRYWREQ